MTVTASTSDARSRPVQLWLVVWAGALAAVLAVFLLQDRLPWAVNYPASAIVPVADWVSALMNLIKSNFSWLTRSITAALGVPLDFALNLLAKNFKIGRGADMIILPRLSWVGVCIAAFLAGRAAGGWKLGALIGGCFLY
ncbi:MAG: ABC transporter permease, partial [Mesorhizobium sp.]